MLRPSFQHNGRAAFGDRGQGETDELRNWGLWELTAHSGTQLIKHTNFPGLLWHRCVAYHRKTSSM
jgi:hypothetical protein